MQRTGIGAVLAVLLSAQVATAQEPAPSTLEPRPEGPTGVDYDQEGVDAADQDGDEASESSYKVTTTTRAPMRNFASDRATNVITDEEIRRRQAKNITDALDEETGVFVQSTNRGAGTVMVRGQIGIENLIYVDGVRFNQSTFRTGPIQYLNTLDPWAMDRVEVVRGPGSVLYGSDAMGGVIQLFPHRIHEQLGTKYDARLMFSSADLGFGAGVDAAARTERFGAQMGGAFRSHHDLRPGDMAGESIVSASQDGNILAESDYDEFHFRGGFVYDLSPRNSVRLNYLGGLVTDAPRVDRVGVGEVRFYENRDDLLWGTYEYHGSGAWDSIRYNVSLHRTRETAERFNCETVDGIASDPAACARVAAPVERRRLNVDETYTLGSALSVSSHVPAYRLRLNWGADIYTDAVTASTRTDFRAPEFEPELRDRGNFQEDSTFSSFGSFLFVEQSPVIAGEHELVARVGARFDALNAFAPDVSAELGDVDYAYVGVVGSAGIAWLYSTVSNLYLNWSQGFRAPNLQETTVLGDTGNFFEVPNDDLGPERSNTFELGNKLDIKNLLRSSTAVWVSLLSDKITRDDATLNGLSVIDGKPVQNRVNRDTAYYYGAELELASYPVFGTHLHGNIAYIDGGVEANGPDESFVEGPLHSLLGTGDHYENPRRLAPFFWTAGITFAPELAWYTTIFVKGAAAQDKLGPGDLDDLRICEASPGVLYDEFGQACPGSEGWATLNVRGGYQTETFRFDASFENLTDLRYRYHGSGLLAPGFNAMLTLTIFQ